MSTEPAEELDAVREWVGVLCRADVRVLRAAVALQLAHLEARLDVATLETAVEAGLNERAADRSEAADLRAELDEAKAAAANYAAVCAARDAALARVVVLEAALAKVAP